MTITLVVEDTDKGFARIWDGLASMKGATIKTGLFGKREATKGWLNEFGTRNMPARPWLSIAADNGEEALAGAMKKATLAVTKGVPAKTALTKVGDLATKIAQQVITHRLVGGPALAASTSDRKGHKIKLVDSGDMVGAIQSKVKVK